MLQLTSKIRTFATEIDGIMYNIVESVYSEQDTTDLIITDTDENIITDIEIIDEINNLIVEFDQKRG